MLYKDDLGAPLRLPAEWEPQESLWLVWPRDPLTWPDGHIDGARLAHLKAMQHVAPHQTIHLIVHPELANQAQTAIQTTLPPEAAANIQLHPMTHQDSWIRDYGPLTLIGPQGNALALKFQFDAWGGKYESLRADDDVTPRLHAAGAIPHPLQTIPFVLEGGAIETDGQGTFLATESVCQGRNQTPDQFEDILRTHLGARHIIWLGDGIAGDDTDGHIDTITRFVAPGTVVTTTAPADHPDHDALADNLQRLQNAHDANGNPLTIYTLPLPDAITTDDGNPLPAGHANFLVTNGAILLPTYGGPSDNHAAQTLSRCFPKHAIVPIDHRDLIWGMGGIHCLSMQIPRSSQPAAPAPAPADKA